MLRKLAYCELHSLRGMVHIKFRYFLRDSKENDDIGFKRLKKDQKGADEDTFFHKQEGTK